MFNTAKWTTCFVFTVNLTVQIKLQISEVKGKKQRLPPVFGIVYATYVVR